MKWVRDFCKQFKIRVYFSKDRTHAGYARVTTRTITLNKKFLRSRKYGLSVLCHEVCHILSYDHNKFQRVYEQKGSNKYMRSMLLRLERYTDKQAAKMLKSFFPEAKYYYGYKHPIAVKWFKENWINVHYPKEEYYDN